MFVVPEPIRRLLRMAAIDRAVGYTLLGRVIALFSAPLTVAFQLLYLTSEQQGYLYSFEGLLGFVALIELGLAPAIGVFASHEMAVLNWGPRGELVGPANAKARLRSLQRIAVAWYSLIALVIVGGILPFGYYFFRDPQSHSVAWRLPWFLSSIVAAGTMLIGPFFAVLEGAGMVSEIAMMRIKTTLASNLAGWTTLAVGGELLAGPAVSGAALCVWLFHLWKWKRRVSSINAGHPDGARVHYWRELWPLQWRIGLSWISGYFTNYLVSPILFKSLGKAQAGHYGMCLRLGNSMQNLSLSWVFPHGPKLGGFIARKEWSLLDTVYFRGLRMTLIIMALGAAAVWSVVCALNYWHLPLAERFLAPMPLGFVMLAAWTMVFATCMSWYVRLHKSDPTYGVQMTYGVTLILAAEFLAGQLGMTAFTFASFVATALLLTCAAYFFVRTRREHLLAVPASK